MRHVKYVIVTRVKWNTYNWINWKTFEYKIYYKYINEIYFIIFISIILLIFTRSKKERKKLTTENIYFIIFPLFTIQIYLSKPNIFTIFKLLISRLKLLFFEIKKSFFHSQFYIYIQINTSSRNPILRTLN